MAARVCGAARGGAGGDFSRGHVEDGLASLLGSLFWFGGFEGCGCWRGWRYGEEGAFVRFRVADEGGDVVV